MVNVSLMYIFNKDRGFGRFGKNCDLNPQYLCIALFEFKSDSSFVLSFIDIATSGYLFFGFVAKIEILEKYKKNHVGFDRKCQIAIIC